MLFVLISLMGITVTQPAILDQTDEEWTASGYRVVEETSINPLDYGEPLSISDDGSTASVGCQAFFYKGEDMESWRIVMLLKDQVVVLDENEDPRSIALTCAPRGIVYSRNGRFALVFGSVIEGDRAGIYSMLVEHVNIETGEVRPFLPMRDTGWVGERFLNDDGSVYRWNSEVLEYYDASLNLVSSVENDFSWSDFAHSADGSLMIIARPDRILAYDKYCNLLWERELSEHLPCSPLVDRTGSRIIVAHRLQGLECLDGFSGELLWTSHESSYAIAPVQSATSETWAAAIKNEGMVISHSLENSDRMTTLVCRPENWDSCIPLAVAESGNSLLSTVDLPSYGSEERLERIVLADGNQEFIWMSSTFRIYSTPLVIWSVNSNLEHDLGGGVNGIQSDGRRFIYSNADSIRIMRIERG